MRSLQLHSEIEHLKRQYSEERAAYLRQADRERSSLTSTVAELQACVSKHEACIAGLQTECQQSQSEVDSLTAHISDLSGEIEGTEQVFVGRSGNIRVRERHGEEEGMEKEKEERREEEEEKKKDKEEEERREEEKRVEEEERIRLQTQLVEVRGKLMAEEKRCERLQAHLARLSEEHDQELGQLLEERERIEGEREREEGERKRSEEEKERVEGERESLRGEKERLEEEVNQLKRTLAGTGTTSHGGGKYIGEKKAIEWDPPNTSSPHSTGIEVVGEAGSWRGHQDSNQPLTDVSLSQLRETEKAVEEDLEEGREKEEEKDAVMRRLRASLALTESEKAELARALERREEEVGGVREEVWELEAKQRDMAEILAHLERENEALRRECREKEKLSSVVDSPENWGVQLGGVGELRSQLREAEGRVSVAEREAEEKEMVLEQLRRNLREVGSLLRTREEEVEELRREGREGERREEGLAGECRRLEAAAEEERMRLGERIASLESEVRMRDEREEERLRKMEEEEEETEKERLRQSAPLLQDTLRRPEQAVQERTALLERLTADRDEREREVSQLSESLAQCRQTIEKWPKERADMDARSAQLSRDLQTAREEGRGLREELEVRAREEVECAKLSKQLEQLRTHLVQVGKEHFKLLLLLLFCYCYCCRYRC